MIMEFMCLVQLNYYSMRYYTILLVQTVTRVILVFLQSLYFTVCTSWFLIIITDSNNMLYCMLHLRILCYLIIQEYIYICHLHTIEIRINIYSFSHGIVNCFELISMCNAEAKDSYCLIRGDMDNVREQVLTVNSNAS